jgi:hypothetical protein
MRKFEELTLKEQDILVLIEVAGLIKAITSPEIDEWPDGPLVINWDAYIYNGNLDDREDHYLKKLVSGLIKEATYRASQQSIPDYKTLV